MSQDYTHDEEPELDLTPEHIEVHSQPLTNRATREALLEQCLDWNCRLLHPRIEDGITDAT